MSNETKNQVEEDIKYYSNAPRAIGKKEYIAFLQGEKLSYKESLQAKCYECCNGYIDGKYDCEVNSKCPLYPLMPYKGKKAPRFNTSSN